MVGIQKRFTVRAAVVVLAATFALVIGCLRAAPSCAYAQAQVTGTDYLVGQDSAAGPGYVDVLSVQGKEGDSIYVNVEHGGKTIASHLQYTLTADQATAGSDGMLAGVMSLQISDFQPTDRYAITAYADYDEKTELYAGTTTGVFARLGDSGMTELLAVRTTGSEQRAFNAPAHFSADGITYDLVSSDPTGTAPLTYAYAEAADTADAVDGTITYVDDSGNVLAITTIPGLQKGAAATAVTIPHAVKSTAGGGASTWWMPVNFAHTVYASYPGTTDFIVSCKQLSLTDADVNGAPFVANITYRSGDTVLLTDEVPVTKLYRYTAPATLTLGSGSTAKTYALSANQDARFDAGTGVLTLDPKSETGAEVAIDINYDEQVGVRAFVVNLWLYPTSSDQALPTRPFATKTYLVRDGDASQVFDPLDNSYVDSSRYELAPGMQTTPYEFSYSSSANAVTNVYYVSKGQKPTQNPYTITIQYRNAADRSLIESHEYTVSPNDLHDHVYTSPEQFTSGGTTYVRLKGQEAGVQHGYYTLYRTYTVWYRDINDSLLADVTVNPLTYATVDDGTTDADSSGIGLGAGDGQNVLTDAEGDGGAALNGEGEDANAERIGDNETPLASGTGHEAGAAEWWTAPVVAGACILALLFLLLMYLRRRNADKGAARQ
ncbi:MAG: hypothetical protein ACI364_06180 [Coriobacteriales bacterium]